MCAWKITSPHHTHYRVRSVFSFPIALLWSEFYSQKRVKQSFARYCLIERISNIAAQQKKYGVMWLLQTFRDEQLIAPTISLNFHGFFFCGKLVGRAALQRHEFSRITCAEISRHINFRSFQKPKRAIFDYLWPVFHARHVDWLQQAPFLNCIVGKWLLLFSQRHGKMTWI